MNFDEPRARACAGCARRGRPRGAAPSPDLARLKAHLTAVQTMTANFIQTDGKGRVDSRHAQMKRPGRMRFAYGGGDLLLVANGKTLNFLDYSVGQKSSWPLGRTPLGPLLSALARFQRQGARSCRATSSRVVVARAEERRPVWAADPRLPAQCLGAGRAAALRLDRDRSAEPSDDGQAVERALQRRGARRRLHIRRAEEEAD